MSIKLKDQNNNEIFIAGTNSEDFINDKVLRNDKTWSSNKIVEELYPTFQKEGNPVTCYPVENYPLNVKATFLPKQAGSGDPSPDNVRPISGYDSVTVTQSKDGSPVKQITLTLPETIYGGTVDAVTGVGSDEWSQVVNLGDASIIGYLDANSNETTCLFYVSGLQNMEGQLSICCSHLPVAEIVGAASTKTGITGNPWGGMAYMRLPRTTASNISEFAEWLDEQKTAGTPVQVAYKLATPEPFQATGNQALPAVAGLNTVYTDGDSLIISGKEDIKYTINQITSNIQNINQIKEINNILLGVE